MTTFDLYGIPCRFIGDNPPKKKSKHQVWKVTWPCGTEYELTRFDIADVPEYENGEQNGISHIYESLKEARECLEAQYDCKVERIS